MYWHVSAKPFYLENLSNYCMRIRKSVRLCLGKSPKFLVRLHYPHPPYFMSCGGKKSAGCMHLSTVYQIPWQLQFSYNSEKHDTYNQHKPSFINLASIIFLLSWDPGPEVIKLFPCSTQLRTKLILLINVKCQQLLAF